MIHTAKAELLVAFPGDKGTNDCVTQALGFGLEVMDLRKEYEYIQNKRTDIPEEDQW